MPDKKRLADLLLAVARSLVSDYHVGDMLYRLCDDVSDILTVDGAGIMLEDAAGDLRFVATSDDTVHGIEALQIELGEGPCLHAYRAGERVVVPDLQDDEHFPRFGKRALAAGMRAVYSFPMHRGDDTIGALNLYRANPGPFESDDLDVGQALADIATTYILNARAHEHSATLTTQLQQALETRIIIEQAKGRVATQLDIPVGQAFELLRTHARNRGQRLHDVAAQVMRGELSIRRP